MHRVVTRTAQASLRHVDGAALPAAVACRIPLRTFVDAPLPDEAVISSMTMPSIDLAPPPHAVVGDAATDAAYVYPLDIAGTGFKLYGESTSYTTDDANRIFASAKVHSYDPTILFNDLRLQEVRSAQAVTNGMSTVTGGEEDGAAHDAEAATRIAEDAENDEVMRSGRNKQVAGGAAAMAAAMLDSRRAMDGIALVPGHPLPVVFPRPDGLPPPLRFVKKFGPGGTKRFRGQRRRRHAKDGDEEDGDVALHGAVMASAAEPPATSLHRSVLWKAQVLDDQHEPMAVKPLQHFHETSDSLPPLMVQGLADAGFYRPTLLQSAAIPQLMSGADVVGVAPNGSGTTVSYAVPSIAILMRGKMANTNAHATTSPGASDGPVARPVVIVLCPTRPTVARTAAIYISLMPKDFHVVTAHSATFTNEEEHLRQRAVLHAASAAGCDVLVATPDRLKLLLRDGDVQLDWVRVLAVDKADLMLDTPSAEEGSTMEEHLEHVLKSVKDAASANDRPAPQLSMWCNTVTAVTEMLVRRFMSIHTVTVVVTREEHTDFNVRQVLYALPDKEDRLAAIRRLYETSTIQKRQQVLVYCVYRETAKKVAATLEKTLCAPEGMVQALHSGLPTRTREAMRRAFQRGEVRILVGTDVATTRLDVAGLAHVVHYDLPASTEIYAQRVNQIGQAGHQGTSHAFFTPGDDRVPRIARFVEQQTGQPLSADIMALVTAMEKAEGSADGWAAPVLRAQPVSSAVSHTKWRVRGMRETRQAVESLSGTVSESDRRRLNGPEASQK